MKKTLSIIFSSVAILSLSSCFLFKPVQKTCPAYSLNQVENNNIELTSTKIVSKINEESM